MGSSMPETAVVSCPGCGARFAVSATMKGRRARCAACETPFVVPELAFEQHDPLAPKPEPKKPSGMPEHVGFNCRVCDTRLFARSEEAGQNFKCPDCGGITVIPAPPPPKGSNMPPALDGEQYELWDAD